MGVFVFPTSVFTVVLRESIKQGKARESKEKLRFHHPSRSMENLGVGGVFFTSNFNSKTVSASS